MKRTLLLLLLLCLGCLPALKAQHHNMSFSASTGHTYTPLQNPMVITNSWDQNLMVHLNIPVVFRLFDKDIDFQAKDGMLVFGSGLVAGGEYKDSVAYAFDGIFTPMHSKDTSSAISYEISGAVGKRILKFEWKNAGLTNGLATDYINYQQWLFEEDSHLEVHFGPMKIEGTNPWRGGAAGAQCGIFFTSMKKGANGKYLGIYFLQGEPSNPDVNTATHSVTLNGAPEEGTVYTFIFEGIVSSITPENENALQFNAYPVPAAEALYLEGALSGQVSITMTDVTGKALKHWQKNAAEGPVQLDIKEVPTGIYFLRVQTAEGSGIKKIMVKK